MIEFERKREHLLKSYVQANLLNTSPNVVPAAKGELELLSRNVEDVQNNEDDDTTHTTIKDENAADTATIYAST